MAPWCSPDLKGGPTRTRSQKRSRNSTAGETTMKVYSSFVERWRSSVPVIAVLGACAVTALLAGRAGADGSGKKYALPPKWDKRTMETFFSDAKSALDGERPNFGDA